MKIYIASDFTNRNGIRKLAAILSAAGHTIVSSWHSLEPYGNDRGAVTIQEKQMWAFTDLANLHLADVLVRLGGGETGRGGQFVELGYAIAKGKQCYILNHHSVKNIFEYVQGVVICTSTPDLLTKLGSAGKLQNVLPFPESLLKQKEDEIMKLEALCTRYSFGEDAKKIWFTDRESKEVVYTGDAGVSREAQINAAYATLMGAEKPEEVLQAAGVEVPVEEEKVDGASLETPKQEEQISYGGTGVVAGNRFDKTSPPSADSFVSDKE